jgi:hypothetical protein
MIRVKLVVPLGACLFLPANLKMTLQCQCHRYDLKQWDTQDGCSVNQLETAHRLLGQEWSMPMKLSCFTRILLNLLNWHNRVGESIPEKSGLHRWWQAVAGCYLGSQGMEQRHFPAQCRSQPDRRQPSDHQFPSEVLVTCTFSTLEIWSSCFDHEKAVKILETGYTHETYFTDFQ